MDVPLLGNGNSGLPDLGVIDQDELKNGIKDTLLICADCGTIEHSPFFDGPIEFDQPFQARLANHIVKTTEGTRSHAIATTRVNAKLWKENEDFRKYIARAISEAQKTGDVGLGQKNYDLKSTFSEDAMRCWRVEHNRTQNCEDYRSDKKRLVPDTRGERKELGLETRSKFIQTSVTLCDYCPYKRIVEDRVRKSQGFY